MSKLLIPLLLLFTILSGCSKDEGSSKEIMSKESKTKIYYTCSMHPHIREDKPGKCPICHMNLSKIELDDSDEEMDSMKGMSSKKQAAKIKEKVKIYYTCSMHPHIRENKPGKCPICHMNLSKIELDDSDDEAEEMSSNRDKNSNISEIIAKVKLRKAQLTHFRPEYFPVTSMKMIKNIRLLGTVLQSEEKESSIPARIGGRVEKVYVKSTGSLIKVGDPVVDLYSPKLITAGEEYIIARKSYIKSKNKEFKDLVKQSEERLKLWGIKKFQFVSWFKKNKVPRSITLFSNSTGIVRKRNANIGKYFKEGQNFFELSDLSDVWVEMDVYEQESNLVSIGQLAEMEFTALPGTILKGDIDFVSPVLDKLSRTLKIRTTVKNTEGKLKPGMVADVNLKINLKGMPLVIPRSAVIDTGKRKVVWLKVSKRKFVAKVIRTGYESEGYVEVKHGLMEGEEVVMEGSFVLDAQAQLFGGYEDPNTGKKSSPMSGHNH